MAHTNLTALQQVILYLRIERGLTLREISDKLCISHQSISNKIKEIGRILEKETLDK